MTVGFDIDGILANFAPAYQRLFVETTGRDDFHPGDDTTQHTWDWPESRGYTKRESRAVWTTIKASQSFWYGLQPSDDCRTLAMLLPALEHRHDIYYITARPGESAKRQTEAWLYRWLPYADTGIHPTVLLAKAKGAAAHALRLDCYIDDKRENAIDVAVTSPATRTYLLDRPYNQGSVSREVRRVQTLGEMFDAELDNL